jgi:hypothetical protein
VRLTAQQKFMPLWQPGRIKKNELLQFTARDLCRASLQQVSSMITTWLFTRRIGFGFANLLWSDAKAFSYKVGDKKMPQLRGIFLSLD